MPKQIGLSRRTLRVIRPAAGFTVAAVTGALVLSATPAYAADTTNPVFGSLSIVGNPYTADVTHGSTQVGVQVKATDDTQIESATVTATCPSGCSATGTGSVDATAYFSGPDTNGIATASLTIPQTAKTGTWQVSTVVLQDEASNQTTVTGSALGSTRSFTVSKQTDNTAPLLTSISSAGTTIDTTTADQQLALSVHATDDVSGVASGDVVLVCSTTCTNPGETMEFDFTADDLQTGTPLDGTFLTDSDTFSFTEQGVWTVQSVDLLDAYGNDNPTATSSYTLTVNAHADGSGPTVSGTPQLSPTSVDSSSDDHTVNLTIKVADDFSGFDYGSGDLLDADDAEIDFTFDTSDSIGNGTYVVPIDVPARTEAGTYTFDSVELDDRYGNASFPDVSSWPSLAVTETGDSAGPTLGDLSAGPSTLNIFNDPSRPIDLNAVIDDDVSGFTSADLVLTDPESNTVTAYDAIDQSQLVSGTRETNGHYASQLYLSDLTSDDIVGSWQITSIDLHDTAGNSRTVTVSNTFTVANTNPHDAAAPTLQSVSVTPLNVDTSTGDQTVQVSLGVKDGGSNGGTASGFSSGYVTLESPSHVDDSYGYVEVEALTAGDDTDGTYTTSLTIPKYDEPGTWRIVDIDLQDNAGNDDDVTGSALSNLISDTDDVTVTGPVDLHGPQLTSITATPNAVDTTTAPSTTFDVHVTDDQATNDGSGVSGGAVFLTSPSGTKTLEADFDYPDDLIGGTDLDGTYATSVKFPHFAQTGSWSVSVELFDNNANETDVSTSDIAAISGSTSTISVTGAPDGNPPVVSAVTFNPLTVSTATGAQPLAVDVHVTDDQATNDGSGVESASIDLVSPTGSQEFDPDLSLVAGTGTDSWWDAVIDVPKYVDPGTWKINSLDVRDAVGNEKDYDQAALTTAGLATGVTITGPADSQAPVIASGGITPPASTIDVRTAPQTANFVLNLQDTDGASNPGSGVESGDVTVQGPNGAQELGEIDSSDRTSGTSTDGTWTVPITFPEFTDSGTWHVVEVDLTDVYGNSASYTGSQLSGFSTGFTVLSNPDTTPPVLTGLTLEPNPIDVTTGSGNLTVTATVTDAASGFDGGFIELTGPAPSVPTVDGFFDGTPTTGTTNSGTFTTTVTIPQYAAFGTWTVTNVELYDAANNYAEYGGSDTALPAGAQSTVTVNDTNADSQPPGVTSIGINPSASINVGGGQQEVTFDLALTDDKSGVVSGGTLELQSPTGVVTDYSIDTEASGTPTSGHWPVSVTFGTNAENGTWTVAALLLQDAAGNNVDLTHASLPATNSFTVSGGVASKPSPPTNVDAVAHNQSADVSWDAPSNGGSPITGYQVLVSPHRAGQTDPDVVTFNTTSTAESVPNLTNGTAYTFEVAATNAVGTGSYSSASTAVTPEPDKPAAPTGVSGTAGDGQVSLSWTAPSNTGGTALTGYHVQYSSNGGSTWTDGPTSALTSTATTAAVTGLTNGTPYVFQVAAINSAGTGSYSTQSASVTPTAGGGGGGGTTTDPSSIKATGAKAIAVGKKVTLTATVTDATSGQPISGAAVRTLQKPGKSGGLAGFSLFGGALTTNSSGTVSITVAPTAITQYLFAFGGSTGHGAATSASQLVTANAVVTLATTAKKVKHNKKVKVYGVVAPNESGQTVVLQVKGKHGWLRSSFKAKLKRQKLPNKKTAIGFVISVKEKKKGSYTFRAVRAATSKDGAGVSKPVTIKVT